MHYSTYSNALRGSVRGLSIHSTLVPRAAAVRVTIISVMCIATALLFASAVLQYTVALRISVNTSNGNASNTFSVSRLM